MDSVKLLFPLFYSFTFQNFETIFFILDLIMGIVV